MKYIPNAIIFVTMMSLSFSSIGGGSACEPSTSPATYAQCMQRMGATNNGLIHQSIANQAIRNQMMPSFRTEPQNNTQSPHHQNKHLNKNQ